MSRPLVSVLVPTYNGQRFIGEAVASAQAQTYAHLEILVGDDGSTDRTPELLAALAAADPRVRVIRHPRNLGAFENPIALLEEARGDYVKFLLHDDILAPECVATLVAPLRADPKIMLATSKRAAINAEGRRLQDEPHLEPMTRQPAALDGHEVGTAMLVHNCNVIGELTTALFRRADVDPRALWQIDGVRLAANGDFALWLDLLARGRLFYTPAELSFFRRHEGQRSMDGSIHAHGINDWLLLIDWARRHGFLGKPEQHRRALARVEATASSVHEALAHTDYGPSVAATLAEAGKRLAALDATVPAPCALAAPAVEPEQIDAAVEALRSIAQDRRAERLVLAIAPARVAEAVPLIEAALARGADIDVDLVPTDSPGALLQPGWLAVVAGSGDGWAAGAQVYRYAA